MIRPFTLILAAYATLMLIACPPSRAQVAGVGPTQRVLDPMDDARSWKVVTPEGVRLSVHEEEGVVGKCLRLDYEFVTGGGYCIIQKDLPVVLPANYEFAFHVRGEGPDNNLEFKLIDKQGDSVWWVNRRAFEWPTAWTRLSNKKRKMEFAWGPSGGAPLTEVSKVEFAIASSSGGKGSVWLDELMLREVPASSDAPPPPLSVSASTTKDASHDASQVLDGNPDTMWMPPDDAKDATLTIDQGIVREFGGLFVKWGAPSPAFVVDLSDDGSTWTRAAHKDRGGAAQSLMPMPEAEARFVKITMSGLRPWRDIPISGDGSEELEGAIEEVRLLDASQTASPNAMVAWIAQQSPRGRYPKYFLGEATYWTVIGEPGDAEESLMNEEGQVEVGKRMFSLEPFLREQPLLGQGEVVRTWADSENTQSLAEGTAQVRRESETHALTISARTIARDGKPWLIVDYDLADLAPGFGDTRPPSLLVALRPFQVNPTYQALNCQGGVASVTSMETLRATEDPSDASIRAVRLKGAKGVRDVVVTYYPAICAGAPFNTGDALAMRGSIGLRYFPPDDPQGLLGAFIDFGETTSDTLHRTLQVPMFDTSAMSLKAVYAASLVAQDARLAQNNHPVTTRLTVPAADHWIADTFDAQLAYILINRDGAALQPGSRSYERSWARDGSLTSAALLACGHAEEARAWIDWFGSHQFENGRIPCVVDSRGPDPVNEYDSNGEYIWAVANYFRYTHDGEFLKAHYQRVQKTVEYIESLRAQRRTAEYLDEASPMRAMYGLVPESISHEGYSAKPMHSYWDDFFVLLGLKEAAYIAEQVGDDQWAQAYAKYAAEFRGCLYDSMRRVFAEKKIDYIPGCVELGDFDSTSTTIALFPCNEQDHAPQAQLRNTFERYWKFARGRMNGEPWEAFTPYELRHVGAFIRLDQRERAYELLTWFHQFQRPEGWHHWAEVVWHDPKTPKFIGDMPHTWVGSDYMNSLLSMFAYDHAGGLVLFGGVPRVWIDSEERVAIDNLHTQYGTLSLSLQRNSGLITARLEGDAKVPEAGFIVKKPPRALGEDIVVRSLPVEVYWKVE